MFWILALFVGSSSSAVAHIYLQAPYPQEIPLPPALEPMKIEAVRSA